MKQVDEFAEFLKSARLKAQLTQSQVAEALGYSTAQFISNWERGISCPPLKNLRSLASMYKVRPDDLFESILKVSIQTAEQSMRREYKSLRSRAR